LLSPPSAGADNAAGDGSDEDDGNSDASGEEGDTHSRALMHLFEVSLDLLSLNAEQHQATRGLRDAVKKAWQAVCALYGGSLSVDVLDSIVAAVIGEEQRADDDGAEEGSEGSDQEESHDDDEMDVESPEKASKSDKKGSKGGKGASKGANKASVSEQDASDEEDVMISDEAAFDMLTEGVDDDSDLEGVLQHSGEADSALAQLIALKQQSRKAGVLQAHKQALLVRSRSIDILEVRVNSSLQNSGVVTQSILSRLVLFARFFAPACNCGY
jgi:hypothetical protein